MKSIACRTKACSETSDSSMKSICEKYIRQIEVKNR